MSRPSMQIVDGDLHAFADNFLPADRRTAILAGLEGDADEGRRVADWCAQNEAIRRTLGKIAFEPVPVALSLAVTSKRPGETAAAPQADKPAPRLVEPAIEQLRPAPQRRRWRSLRRLLALVMVAGVAGLFGLATGRLGGQLGTPLAVSVRTEASPFSAGGPGDPASAYALRALEAHRTFALDGQYPVEIGAAQLPRLLQWLDRRVGQRVAVPDLQPIGFTFLGGRLVSGSVGPSAFLVFQNGGAERLGLMIARPDTGNGQGMRYRAAQGIGVVTWSQNGSLAALSGPADASRLTAAAKLAAAGMKAPERR